MMEFDFKGTPNLDKKKIVEEIGKIANAWWKNRNDPVLLERFAECCRKLGSQSIETAESSLMLLCNWLVEIGGYYERVHRFHVRIEIGIDVVDIKINYHDFEYFVLINNNVEKMFKHTNEIKPWLILRFNLTSANI